VKLKELKPTPKVKQRNKTPSAVIKYDTLLTNLIAKIPAGLIPLSSLLGKFTLPSIWVITLLGVSVLLRATDHQDLATLGLIIAICMPICSVVKLFVRRSRPKTAYARNMRVKSYSFPSSHAYAATIAGGFLSLVSLTLLPAPLNVIGAGLYGIIIALVGISRIHVGAHFPSDIAAGWVLGLIVLIPIIQIIL
jgi:undecaprenyl-diphosphatase